MSERVQAGAAESQREAERSDDSGEVIQSFIQRVSVGDRVLAPDLEHPGSLELLMGVVRAVWDVEGEVVCLVSHSSGIRRHWYARNLLPLRPDPVRPSDQPQPTLDTGRRVKVRDRDLVSSTAPSGNVLRVVRVGESELALVRHDCGKVRHWHTTSLAPLD